MIRVEHLTQHYGVRPIIRDLSFTIDEGELVSLMGPNGMGKSTLLASMAGVLTPQKGFIEIDGRRRKSSLEAEQEIVLKVFYLPDDPWLPESNTIREYLLAIARIYEVEDDRLFDHFDQLLDLFSLSDMADSHISKCSKGQKKKVAISSALISDAPILLLDEPFSGGLDPEALNVLRRILLHLAEQKERTVVMATPVPEIVEGLTGRVAVLRNGEIVAFDTAARLRECCDGAENLSDVLTRLISPKSPGNLDRYFEKQSG